MLYFITVTGLPLNLSILTIGIIGLIYTAIGGLKAVIWCDVVQGCMMIVGTIFVLICVSQFT